MRRGLIPVLGAAALLAAGCGGSNGSNAAPGPSSPAAAAPSVSAAQPSPSAGQGQNQWVTLPGHVDDRDSTSLLMSHTDGSAGLYLSGETASWQTQLAIAPDLTPATIDVDEDGNAIQLAGLAPESAAHPDGTTLVTVAATTPASGLTAQQDRIWLLQYDNATGRLLSKAVIGVAGNGNPMPQPVESDDTTASLAAPESDSGSVRLEHLDIATGRKIASLIVPHAELDDTYANLALLTITGQSCNHLAVYDVAALHRVSVSSGYCLSGDTGGTFLNASQYSGQADPQDGSYPYSVATGDLLGHFTPQGADNVGELQEVTGARSTVSVAWDSSNVVNAGFYDAGNWKLIYEVRRSAQLDFSCSGVADNDVWVTTTSGNIVVNGLTGQQIESGWRVSPGFGGQGWTVFDGPQPQDGEAQQYLLRYTGPVVSQLASAPDTSGQ